MVIEFVCLSVDVFEFPNCLRIWMKFSRRGGSWKFPVHTGRWGLRDGSLSCWIDLNWRAKEDSKESIN